jgi:hypothetical protein
MVQAGEGAGVGEKRSFSDFLTTVHECLKEKDTNDAHNVDAVHVQKHAKKTEEARMNAKSNAMQSACGENWKETEKLFSTAAKALMSGSSRLQLSVFYGGISGTMLGTAFQPTGLLVVDAPSAVQLLIMAIGDPVTGYAGYRRSPGAGYPLPVGTNLLPKGGKNANVLNEILALIYAAYDSVSSASADDSVSSVSAAANQFVGHSRNHKLVAAIPGVTRGQPVQIRAIVAKPGSIVMWGGKEGGSPGIHGTAQTTNESLVGFCNAVPITTPNQRTLADECTLLLLHGKALSIGAGKGRQPLFETEFYKSTGQPYPFQNLAEKATTGDPEAIAALQFVTGQVPDRAAVATLIPELWPDIEVQLSEKGYAILNVDDIESASPGWTTEVASERCTIRDHAEFVAFEHRGCPVPSALRDESEEGRQARGYVWGGQGSAQVGRNGIPDMPTHFYHRNYLNNFMEGTAQGGHSLCTQDAGFGSAFNCMAGSLQFHPVVRSLQYGFYGNTSPLLLSPERARYFWGCTAKTSQRISLVGTDGSVHPFSGAGMQFHIDRVLT